MTCPATRFGLALALVLTATIACSGLASAQAQPKPAAHETVDGFEAVEYLRRAELLLADFNKFGTRSDVTVSTDRPLTVRALIAKKLTFEGGRLVIPNSDEPFFIIADEIIGTGTITWSRPPQTPLPDIGHAAGGTSGPIEGASGLPGAHGVAGPPGAVGASAPSLVIIVNGTLSAGVIIDLSGQDGQAGGRGQHGGAGGQGRDGQSASQDAFNCRRGPGQGGNGGAGGSAGPGGAGGNGGMGGVVTVLVPGPLPQLFAPIVAGGRFGVGGEPGNPGPGGAFGNPGAAQLPWCNARPDRRGAPGAPGQIALKGPDGAPGRSGVVRAGTLDAKAVNVLFKN